MTAPAATAPLTASPELPVPAPPPVARSGLVRVAIFFGVAAAGIGLLQLASGLAAGAGIPGLITPAWAVTTLALGLVAAHAVVIRRFHAGDWSYAGLQRSGVAPGVLSFASVAGVLTIAVPSLLLLGGGALRVVQGIAGTPSLWPSAASLWLVLAPAALWEELAVRGYLLSALGERFGVRAALFLTSALFGVLHLQNAGATMLSTAAVMLAGVFLGLVRLSTGSLYAAWVAHLAWNVTMAFALRTPVSGLDLTLPGYRVVDAGPDWLTGGAWGPEGGVAAMLGMGAASWFMVRRIRRGS